MIKISLEKINKKIICPHKIKKNYTHNTLTTIILSIKNG